RCVAVDPFNRDRVYCGTSGNGVWWSEDGGGTWQAVGEGVGYDEVTAVAVSPVEEESGLGVVYVGTEPSRVFRSVDGGASWEEQSGLTELPSADSWSFPPKPYTHHVRWIEADPHVEGRIFVCIEAGALVRSLDGGETWVDRVPGGPYDTHTLATHVRAAGRVYSAAGDGYFESYDGGESWEQPMAGLRHRYVVGLAVDPADPDVIVVSAASSPRRAYNAGVAESYLYRRAGEEPWEAIGEGLPAPEGMTINIPASHPAEPGVFYSANNHGVYRSSDAGLSWSQLDIEWPQAYRSQRVQAVAVVVRKMENNV
ncbi:MAG: glycoside hydrolase, partial [Chloroflexota bacterium]|nr:glycoside hydrolase [Chloroflexota bacterium]